MRFQDCFRERRLKFAKGQKASRHAEIARTSLRMQMILLPEEFTSHGLYT